MSFLKTIFFPKNKNLFKYIFTLATPVIFSNISRVLMGLMDLAMVKTLGAAAIAGVGFAGMIAWAPMSLGIAFRTGTQTFVARRLGQKKYDRCSVAFRNMQFFAIIIGLPITFFCYTYTEPIISLFFTQSDNAIDLKAFKYCIEYASITFLGTYAMYVNFIFQGFYTGIEKTKIHMRTTISSSLINLYLNVGLIFGTDFIINPSNNYILNKLSFLWTALPFPSEGMGVKGAAIGTLIATICMAIHYFINLFEKEIINKYKVFKSDINIEMLKRQIVIAFPVGMQEILSMMSLVVFYSIIKIIGTIELAATHVIFKIMHASFMPAIGVGQACATLVGKFLGENNPDKSESAINESLRGSMYIMGTIGILFICCAQYIVPLFVNSADFNVMAIAIPGLRFIGMLQIIDAVCFTLWFALTGAGDTKVPAMVDILSHWIFFVPISYLLGITFELGFWGPWIAFGMHLTFFSTYIYLRFKRGKWKKIIV